ncbi:MAG: hypothetical protein KKF46_04910 [Nanoarchaeota archaeon]|nr:hypothetical protein [Nanoarchaeota archaeon]MBU1321673.1 hypothetical protein [Nanoarchaeota archaeon]MBU1598415.1 hypothetical protein [Nanoarchaeota archaeon]MBU2441041.1 hypothetical protein [Nanoarchaeota archaeon]
MKKTILVTRPDYDDATGYLFHYSKQIINSAKNIKVLDLTRPRLTRKNFTNLIHKQNPLLIFFNAHGNENLIYGDKIGGKEEILVEENKNHSLLTNRITYARACWAAASLGKTCVAEGGCFIGYKTPFSFWFDERWSAKPSNDKIARIFLEPSNLIVSSLLKGNSAQEAFDKSITLSKKHIMKLLKIKEEPGMMASIMILWNNIKGQDIFGDRNLCFL